MKRNAKSALVFALTASLVLSSAGVSEAKAKKPTLSKTKTTITVGQKQKITVKKVKPKKTTWSLTKKGKKIVSISKKKKTSVYIKGKKVGKATLTAKIKVGKKTYKKTVKITVKKKTTPTATPKPVVPTQAPTKAPTKAPTQEPTKEPTQEPTQEPTKEPTPAPTHAPGVIKPSVDEAAGTLTYNNLDTASDYEATVNGKVHSIRGEDIAAELNRTIDLADFYEKWTSTKKVEKTLCGATIIAEKNVDNPNQRKVTVSGTDSRFDGSYTVLVEKDELSDAEAEEAKAEKTFYSIWVTKSTGKKMYFEAFNKRDEAGNPFIDIHKFAWLEEEEKYEDNSSAELKLYVDKNKKFENASLARFIGDTSTEDGYTVDYLAIIEKNADGNYDIMIDKAEADKRGFKLVKK